MDRPRPKCRKTGKIRFGNKPAAERALLRAQVARELRGQDRNEKRVYECRGCGGWHLTSLVLPETDGGAQ